MILLHDRSKQDDHEPAHSGISLQETAKATPPSTSSPQLQISDLKSDSSLSAAFSEARHAISGIDDTASQLPGNEGARYFAFNPGQALAARFMDGAVRIGDETLSATFTRDGIEGRLPAPIAADDARVEYQHSDGIVEWWVNGTEGMQQGFTVPAAPAGTGEIHLPVKVEGMTVSADPDSAGDLVFSDGDGTAQLAYRGLKAWDARGTTLDARMTPTPAGLEIAVASHDAVFPVTIDPVVVRLQSSFSPMPLGPAGLREEFTSIDLEGDLAVAGVPFDEDSSGLRGAVYIFERTNGSWKFVSRLRATPRKGERMSTMGQQVTISNGVIYTGAPAQQLYGQARTPGFLQTFVKSGRTWKAGVRIEAPPAEQQMDFCSEFAVSGNRLVIGGYDPNNNYAGRTWCYRKSGAKWQLEQTLAAGGTALVMEDDLFVVRSGDGLAFYRYGSTGWALEDTVETIDPANFVSGMSLSNGSLWVGVSIANHPGGERPGAVFHFRKEGAEWTSTRLDPPNPTLSQSFGSAVESSGDFLFVGNGVETIHTYEIGTGVPVAGPVLKKSSELYRLSSVLSVSGNRFMVGGVLQQRGTGLGGSNIVVFERDAEGAWNPVDSVHPGYNGEKSLTDGGVATIGDRTFVGAPADANPAGFDSGCVYVLLRTKKGWKFEKRLTSPAPLRDSHFGMAVAAVRGRLVVGTNELVDPTGNATIAHVFAEDQGVWTHESALAAPFTGTASPWDMTMATQGDRVLIGLPHDSHYGSSGLALIYRKQAGSWSFHQRFNTSIAVKGNFLGLSVALDANSLWLATDPYPGSSYIHGYALEGDVWVKKSTFQPPSGGESSLMQLSLSGGNLWVACQGWYDTGGVDVYAVENGVATFDTTLTRPNEEFRSVALFSGLSGDLGFVCSTVGDDPITGVLHFYQHTSGGWQAAGRIPLSPDYVAASSFHGDTLALLLPGSIHEASPGEPVELGSVSILRIGGDFPDIDLQLNRKSIANGKRLSVPVNGSPVDIYMENLGKARLADIEARIEGPQASEFTLEGVTPPIAPGAQNGLRITRNAGSRGSATARLVITSNDPDENSYIVVLKSDR